MFGKRWTDTLRVSRDIIPAGDQEEVAEIDASSQHTTRSQLGSDKLK